MKKELYFQKLKKLIRRLPEAEAEKVLSFYREIVEDRMEVGMSEEAAILGLGDVRLLAKKILVENPARRGGVRGGGALVALCFCAGFAGLAVALTFGMGNYRTNSTTYETTAEEIYESSSSGSEVTDVEVVEDVTSVNAVSGDAASGVTQQKLSLSADGVKSIEIEAELKNIIIAKAGAAGTIEAVCDTDKDQNCELKAEGSTLVVKSEYKSDKLRSDFWKANNYNTDITKVKQNIRVSIPANFEGKLKIETDVGLVDIDGLELLKELEVENELSEINLNQIYADKVKLTSELGRIYLDEVTAGEMEVDSSLGEIDLVDIKASRKVKVTSEMGAVSFTRLESPEIEVETEMGAIEGSIIGREEDYRIETEGTMAGMGGLKNKSDGTKRLKAKNSFGNIEIQFVNN